MSCFLLCCLTQILNPYSHKKNFGSTKSMFQVKQLLKEFHVKSNKGDKPHEENLVTSQEKKVVHRQIG